MTLSRHLVLFVSLILASVTTAATADDHAHHARHNMLIYGSGEVFASHIVYKAPHNYQVIFRVVLPEAVATAYHASRALHPDDTYLWLLDPLDMSTIESQTQLSGTFFREDATGEREILAPSLALTNDAYKLLLFNQLPLALD